jgi:hypothetical protein
MSEKSNSDFCNSTSGMNKKGSYIPSPKIIRSTFNLSACKNEERSNVPSPRTIKPIVSPKK